MDKLDIKALREEFERYKGLSLSLDMSRGKPDASQLDLSTPMLSALDDGNFISEEGLDVRNYGGFKGLIEARRLFGEILGLPAEQVLAGGNSSLNMLCDAIKRCFLNGAEAGGTPWKECGTIKFLCPVPGYDWHFHICDTFGIETVSVPMDEGGPVMEQVEELVKDPAVKGFIASPMYSNPTGLTFSDECVERLAAMETAAPDFRIFWDNAYCMHHLYDDRRDALANIYEACLRRGHADRPLLFTSTSKITYAGAGICAMGASPANIEYAASLLQYQMVCYDKMNQLRHVRFLPNRAAVEEHMRRQAAILRPKFALVERILEEELGGLGSAEWTRPLGGYFVCFRAPKGCAKRVVALCAEAGVTLTPAGAPFPGGVDPEDSVIRLAPTYPPLDELEAAMKIFALAVKIASAEREA